MRNETLNNTNEQTIPEEDISKTGREVISVLKMHPKKRLFFSSDTKAKKIFSFSKLSIAFSCLVIFLVSYFILFPSRGFISADSVDTLMWAQASYDSHSLFNSDFGYACLLPFGGQLLMVPMIAIFGVTMKAQVFGMLLFFILFTIALFAMLKQMHWGIGWSCFAVSCMLMILSGSEKLREIFWEHIIYYSLGIFFMFVGLALVFKTIHLIDTEKISRKFLIFSALVFVWCMLTATNQLEALTIFSIPLIGAIIGERFFSSDKMTTTEKLSDLIVLAATVLGTGVGYVLGNILKRGFTAGYQSAYSTFSPTNTWFEHLGMFFSHWSTLLGVDILDNDKIMSRKGIINLLLILLSFILLIAPIAATILYPKIKDRTSRIVILFHWIMTALIMMGFIFGKLSAANWRLSPIVCTSVLVTVMLCRWLYYRGGKKRLVCIIILPVLLCGIRSMLTIVKMPPNYKQDQGLYSVSKVLQDNQLSYGYATFWNANVLTVLSDSKVKARNVDITNNGVSKNNYQSQNNWYMDQPGQENYFLLASAEEYDIMKNNNNILIELAVKTIPISNYTILVFGTNIF